MELKAQVKRKWEKSMSRKNKNKHLDIKKALGMSEEKQTPAKPFELVTPKADLPEWGKRIDFDEYLAIDRISSHSLMDFCKSPRLYKRKKDGLAPSLSSDDMVFGTACHTFILEGSDEFKKQYVVGGPINDRTGKPYGKNTDAYAEFAATCGKKIISDSDYAKICEMHQGVLANSSAMDFITDGIPEIVILTELKDMKVKMRLDMWCPDMNMNMDLKTTRNLDTFVDDFWLYQYDIQAGMFGNIFYEIAHEIPPFYILACEKEEPYRSQIYAISEHTMFKSMQKVKQLMFNLKCCIADDCFPYGTEVDKVI